MNGFVNWSQMGGVGGGNRTGNIIDRVGEGVAPRFGAILRERAARDDMNVTRHGGAGGTSHHGHNHDMLEDGIRRESYSLYRIIEG